MSFLTKTESDEGVERRRREVTLNEHPELVNEPN